MWDSIKIKQYVLIAQINLIMTLEYINFLAHSFFFINLEKGKLKISLIIIFIYSLVIEISGV